MMENKHTPYDLKQMQSLPLEAKIRMTEARIQAWHEAWKKYEILDTATGKTRTITWCEEPTQKGCFQKCRKKIANRYIEVDVLVKGTQLKETECVTSEYDGQVYVSFSGGKDSTVLLDICRKMYPDIEAVFVDTGLEYPEIRKFVKTFDNVTWLRPEMSFKQVCSTYGYPFISKEVSESVYEARRLNDGKTKTSRLLKLKGEYKDKDGNKSQYNIQKYEDLLYAPFMCSQKCCLEMKKKPVKAFEKGTGKMAITGQMAEESRLRKTSWIKNGCNGFNMKRPMSNPLSFWTEQDVLHYIKQNNLQIASVYGDIVVEEKVDGEKVLVGQMNLIDYLGCYEENDKLTTTGCQRTGCMFCGFGCHIKGDTRFLDMKRTHPRQYDFIFKSEEEGGLGYKEKIDYIEHCNTDIKY